MRTYKNVFVGNETVDYLVEKYPITRDGAVNICRGLEKRGLLHHVVKMRKFEDDHLFYVFNENDVVGSTNSEVMERPRSEAPTEEVSEVSKVEKQKEEKSMEDSIGNILFRISTLFFLLGDKKLFFVAVAKRRKRSKMSKAFEMGIQTLLSLSLEAKALFSLSLLFFVVFGFAILQIIFVAVFCYLCFKLGMQKSEPRIKTLQTKIFDLQDALR